MVTRRRRNQRRGDVAHPHDWRELAYETTPDGRRAPRGKVLWGCAVEGCIETKVETLWRQPLPGEL